jgi:hypothetical protein
MILTPSLTASLVEVVAPMIQLIPVAHIQVSKARRKEARAAASASKPVFMRQVYPPLPLSFM